MPPLIGTVAIVTGASSGIGDATARRLAEHGSSVAVVARRKDRLDILDYDLVPTPPSRRALAGLRLPEAVAAAVIEFLTAALIDQPYRVGKPLRADLDGVWSARRGTYRVLYRVRGDLREVIVLRIEHRRDAYRPM